MVEKREKHRRHYKPISQFPLNSQGTDWFCLSAGDYRQGV
jgi:hypothetical protein